MYKDRKLWTKERVTSRLSGAVHRRSYAYVEGEPSVVWVPPFPPREAKGYPLWVIEHRDVVLTFASPEEIDHAIQVLGQKLLPRPWTLDWQWISPRSGNGHWLSRLPSKLKPYRERQKIVSRLKVLRAAEA